MNILELEDVVVEKPTSKSLIYSDCSELTHPLFSDLVNNEYLFNEYYLKNKKNNVNETWSDDSDYSLYPKLKDIAHEIVANPWKYKDITVVVSSEDIYSSSRQRGGFDRPEDLQSNGGYEKATESLRITNANGQPRGFISANCPTMNGFIRWHYDKKGNITGFTVVKGMGNHRFVLKKRANGGKSTYMLIKLHFHPVNPNETLADIIRRESDSHHTDAQNQQGQTEEQKAYSGYKSGRKEYVELVNFFKELQIDYAGILKQENLLLDPENTPTITSISRLNGGLSSGVFKKLGYYNVRWALETAREISLHPSQKDELKSISHSAVMCFANLYHFFTEEFLSSNRDQTPIMTKEQLKFFLVKTFTTPPTEWDKPMALRDLSQTGSQKDYNVINSVYLIDKLNTYYKARVPTKTGERRKNGFGMENTALIAFFNSISDTIMRNFAVAESGL